MANQSKGKKENAGMLIYSPITTIFVLGAFILHVESEKGAVTVDPALLELPLYHPNLNLK